MESIDITIKLRKKLLCNYDKTVKPIKDGSPLIKLTMEMIRELSFEIKKSF